MRNILLAASVMFCGFAFANELPDIKMPDNNISFKQIKGYEDYKIVATHFRKDKNELRYVLANKIAYKAITANKLPLPNGSKIVKIGWSVKPMSVYPDAIEADKLQRVEFMVKNSKLYNNNGDNWGYARFVKKDDGYVPYANGSAECIACHSAVASNDYLFTILQKTY